MRILIVEDEFKLAEVISDRLKKENYETDISTDGESGLYNALTDSYDLIILDIMLPKIDGTEILRQVRENNISSKVIMLTARSSIEDKLTGLTGGANDYLTKPFHIDELVARINIQLRSADKNFKEPTVSFGDIVLNTQTSQLSLVGKQDKIDINNKEFQILEYFIHNPNIILSKEQIYDRVWGYENEIESNNLEAYLSFIRRKLKFLGSKTSIKAVRGMGYRMEYNK